MTTSTFIATLLHVSLRATVLLLIAFFLAALLKRASAASRHLVWGLAFFGLALLPIVSLALPAWQTLPNWHRGDAPVTVIISKQVTPAPATVTATLPADLVGADDSNSNFTPPLVNARSTPIPSSPWNWSRTALWTWGLVAALLLFRLGRSHFRLARLSRSSPRLETGRLHQRLHRVCAQLGIKRHVELYLRGPSRGVPMVFGVFKHRVILPLEAEDWPDDRLDAVFWHELAHVKRRDPMIEWGVRIVSALYWFHPLVWIAAKQLRHERERACDDWVLSQGIPSPDYAEHLLRILSGSSASNVTPGLAMADPGRLEARMEAILRENTVRTPVGRCRRWLGIVGCLALIFPLALLQAAPDESDGITYRLEGLDAERVHEYLKKRFGDDISVKVDATENSLRIAESDTAVLKELKELIQTLDFPRLESPQLLSGEPPRALDQEISAPATQEQRPSLEAGAQVGPHSAHLSLAPEGLAVEDLLPIIDQLSLKLQGLRDSGLGPKHPRVLEAQGQLAQTRDLVQETVESLHASIRDRKERQREEAQSTLAQLLASGIGPRHPRVRQIQGQIDLLNTMLENPPATETAEPPPRDPSKKAELTVKMDAEGKLWLGESQLSVDQIGGKFTDAIIIADRVAPFQNVVKAITELQDAGVTNVSIQAESPSQ